MITGTVMPGSGNSSPWFVIAPSIPGKGKVTMKSLIQQARYFRSTGSKIVLALAFASAISGLSISPVLADNDDGHGRDDRRSDHNRGNQRGERGHEWRGEHERYSYPYVYAQPVYAPPPVYYEPRPSPGISIFFPIDLR